MTSKQLAIKLMHQLAQEFSYTDNITLEQVDLAVKLAQSFETDEERAERIAKFNKIVTTAVASAQQYS